MFKIKRKKKRKKNEERVTYDNAFGRVLIQFMAEYQRVEEEQKTKKILIKKKAAQTRKINAAVKKQMIADNKIKRAAARVVKKAQKNEKARLKAFERKVQ